MSINRENKLTDWLPFVADAVQQINAAFPALTWGTYGGHHPSKNRATDGMVPGYKTAVGKALGWACAKWVWANRQRLDVWYVIFDAKIISTTYPNSGWRTYTPDAAAVKRSRDSAYHYNHVHVSHTASGVSEGLSPVELVPNLPTYYVDPESVETFLWGIKHSTGEAVKQREPGYPITTGVGFVTLEGGKWLVTESGYRYHTDYLTTTRPAIGGGDVTTPEPVLPTYTVKAGDTLTKIATAHGLSGWNVIVDVNPDMDPNHLRVGQVINLPAEAKEPEPEPPTPEPEKPVAETYWVDPAKVETFLWGVDDATGEPVKKRPPRYRIRTATELVERNGATWVLTEAGYRYHLDYLTTTEPPPEPEPEDMTAGRFVILNAGDSSNEKGRAAGLADLITDYDPSVIAGQEWSAVDSAAIFPILNRRGGKWDFYKAGNRIVGWDTTKWIMRREKKITLKPDRQVPAVLLESRKTGWRGWFYSVHLTHTAEMAALRDRQIRQLTPWLKALGPEPKIGGGDINDSGTAKSPGSVRDIMKGAGFPSTINLDDDPTHRGGKKLDEFFHTADVEVRSVEFAPLRLSATDHALGLLRWRSRNPKS